MSLVLESTGRQQLHTAGSFLQEPNPLPQVDEAGSALERSWFPCHTGMVCDPWVLGQQQPKLFPQLLQEDTCAL